VKARNHRIYLVCLAIAQALALCLPVAGCATLLGTGSPADEGSFSIFSKKPWTITLRNAASVYVCDVRLWKEKPGPADATEAYDRWIDRPIAPGGFFLIPLVPSDARYNLRAYSCPAGYTGENGQNFFEQETPHGPVLVEKNGLAFRGDEEVLVR
jgi:hypothetical protein